MSVIFLTHILNHNSLLIDSHKVKIIAYYFHNILLRIWKLMPIYYRNHIIYTLL